MLNIQRLLFFTGALMLLIIPVKAQQRPGSLITMLEDAYRQDINSIQSGRLASSATANVQIMDMLVEARDQLLPLPDKFKEAIAAQAEVLESWQGAISKGAELKKQRRVSRLGNLANQDLVSPQITQSIKPETLKLVKDDLLRAIFASRKSEELISNGDVDFNTMRSPADAKYYLEEALKKLNENQNKDKQDQQQKQQDQKQDQQNQQSQQEQQQGQQQNHQGQQEKENQQEESQKAELTEAEKLQREQEAYEKLKREMIRRNLEHLEGQEAKKPLTTPRVQVERDW